MTPEQHGQILPSIRYLQSVGFTLDDAPLKFRRRGFEFYCPQASQMLTREDVIVFARNERELRDPS